MTKDPNDNMPPEFTDRVEKKVTDKLALKYEMTDKVTTLIARQESLNIVVAILNALLVKGDDGEKKLTDREISIIQQAVAEEAKKTENLYDEINKLMNNSAKEDDDYGIN